MKVINIHSRLYNHPVETIIPIFNSLATENDLIWPIEKWPKIFFKDGKIIGSHGGHGPIRYTIVDIKEDSSIKFKFYRPKGFNGIHKFELLKVNDNQTELKHTIDMSTNGLATLIWIFAIRWLHDALVEDAFDKVNKLLLDSVDNYKYPTWTKLLRSGLNI